MSFGQPSSFGVLNNSQNAPNSAFSRSSSLVAQGPAEVLMGDEVQETESDLVGYVSLAGELKVKVFDGQYPENEMPIPSSQLLAISQKRQLFAAGGPQGVVVARTSTLRTAFKNTNPVNGNNLPFQPECIIPMSIRLSHVAFTSDGTYLLLGAQVGGIAVYLVDEILSKGNQVQPHSQISTGPLLEMKPIPTAEGAERVCIVVGSGWSQGGTVGIVNVKTKEVQANLKSGVTSVSWSPKGKQIICGGSGGGLAWIKPDGNEADVVPGVPNYPNHFVSSVFWIETDIVFVVVSPKLQPGSQHDNESVHFVLIREQRKHTFYRVNDMTPPFGMTSRPTYHSFLHLKAWAPNLKDCLILSNTCSGDIGTVLRLNNTPFTPTTIISDGRRATLPLSESGDQSPIGFALDLTAIDSERVLNPYPNVEQSATSLPSMWILTNEGVISAYWVVYSDAVKIDNSSAAYPELLAYESQQPPQTPQRATGPSFGQSGLGSQSQTSAFGAPKSTFGASPTPASAFGQPARPSGFGTAAAFGQTSQPASAFGQPSQPAQAFGQASKPQSAFGQLSTPQSAFGQTAPKPSFGQPAFGSSSTLGRPGMTPGAFGSTPGGSAFGSQAGTSGFGQKPATPAFGSTTTLGSTAPSFGSTTAMGTAAPAFGSSTPLGATRPAFGQPATGGFGQPAQLGSKLSAFGSTPGASGFAKFSGAGGFLGASGTTNSNAPAAFLQQSGSGNNPFAQKPANVFESAKNNAPASAFGSGSTGGFTMTSAFGSTATPDNNKSLSAAPVSGAFGNAFGNSLGSAISQPAASANIKDDEMADSDEEVEQPRQGVRGGNMFNVSGLGANSSTDAAKETPKPLAPAFGQASQPSGEAGKPSAFGTGLFGSTLNKEQPKAAFGSPSKPALAPAFGTQEPKPTGTATAFTPGSPEKPSSQVGTGLFGSALQRSTSGAQPVSAFGPAASASPSKPASAFGAPAFSAAKPNSAFGTAPAFGKPNAPVSAFGTGSSSPSKTVVPAFGQKSTPPSDLAKKPSPTDEAGAAANKGLPDDDSEEETDHPEEAEPAPLPPDFVPKTKKTEAAVPLDAPLPPDFTSAKKPVTTVSGALKTPISEPASGNLSPPTSQKTPENVDKASDVKSGSPSKLDTAPPERDSAKSSSSGQTSVSVSKIPKAVNPLATRRGTKMAGAPAKTLSSGRIPSQKAGATAKPSKLVHRGNDFDNDEDNSSSKLKGKEVDEKKGFKFFSSNSKDISPQKVGQVDFSLSTTKPGEKFSGFEISKEPLSFDSSNENSDETGEGDSDEDASLDEDDPEADYSDQSSELDDGSWVETGDVEEEESPIQPVPDHEPRSQKSRQESGGLFARTGPSHSVKPIAGGSKQVQVSGHKATDISRIVNKTPILPAKPTKTAKAVESALSPASAKMKQLDELERQRIVSEKNQLDTERERAEKLIREKENAIVQQEASLELIRRQEEAAIRNMNANERAMNERDALYKKQLEKPLEPCSTLKQLIPYRDAAPFTNFKGHDAYMEHMVITLERRIDNFGMNMRQLEAFVSYHRDGDHWTLDDPRPVDEIKITAAPDVSMMAKDLIDKAQELDKTFDLAALKANVATLVTDVDHLVARASDIPNIILLHTHPELRAHIRRRPLSTQQRMQQASLRRKVPLMRRKIKRVDDAFRMLQAHAVSANKNQKANYGDIRPPTIEQVRETVARLTDVAKEKAERVDKLEDALRRMRVSTGSPAMSRGTTPSFRASSVSFSSTPGRGDRERSVTPSASAVNWKSSRKGKETILATPPRNTPGPDTFAYYENTIDSPISRFTYKESHRKAANTPGGFGLIEEELGDDEYFNDQNASSSMGVPIATSYDRGMAELRKEILTTPKKGDKTGEVPNTPASRQVNRLLKGEVELMLGNNTKKAWVDAEDYMEDRKLRKDVAKRMTKVMRKIGVKTTKVELA